jgi:hypothetical protein
VVESRNSVSSSTLSRVCFDCDEELGGDVESTSSGGQEREGDIDATASDPRDIEENSTGEVTGVEDFGVDMFIGKILCILRAIMVATRMNSSRS